MCALENKYHNHERNNKLKSLLLKSSDIQAFYSQSYFGSLSQNLFYVNFLILLHIKRLVKNKT